VRARLATESPHKTRADPPVTQQSIADVLADFVARTSYDALGEDARHAARRCLLDFCGSALRGAVEPQAHMAREMADAIAAGTGASRFPDGAALTPAGAALVNGVSSHIVELDDLHNPSTFHPAAPIIPAVLAAAEREGASGMEVLRAIVLGYEVGIRIAEAVNPTHYRYWHPTGTCGAFGAAAGVGVILGLDAEAMAHALGSAGTQASGLWAFIDEGAMSKHLHAGRAAENGLVAAYLAAQGFTGARRIVESPRGFVAATTDEADPQVALRGLGSRAFKILENGFKVHACCGHTHTALDLAIEMGERLPIEQIERVHVNTYQAAVDVAGIDDPRTPYEARFSLRFTTALGLTRGEAGLETFSDALVSDREIRALMKRIKIEIDPELTAQYPLEWGCKLTVAAHEGQTLTATALHPRGMPANPLSDVELHEKYRALADVAVGAETAERLAQRVWALPDGDAAELFGVLRIGTGVV
jgi:2-methylcitrate dehydratase PrpD